jgi:hypothetical protein
MQATIGPCDAADVFPLFPPPCQIGAGAPRPWCFR